MCSVSPQRDFVPSMLDCSGGKGKPFDRRFAQPARNPNAAVPYEILKIIMPLLTSARQKTQRNEVCAVNPCFFAMNSGA